MGHIRFFTRRRIIIAAALGLLSTITMTHVLPAVALARQWTRPESLPQPARISLDDARKPELDQRTWFGDWWVQRFPLLRDYPVADAPGEGPRPGLLDEDGEPVTLLFSGPLSTIVTYKAGWPFRAAAAELHVYYATPNEPYKASRSRMLHLWRWAIPIRTERRWEQVAVPLRPLWLGLAGNIAFYTVAWLPVVGLIGAAADWRKRRPGTCRACGYELRGLPAGSPCPECGRGAGC